MLEKRIIVHIWGPGEKCVLGTLLQLNNLPFKPLLTLSDIPLYNLQGTGMQCKPIMTQNLEFMRWEEFFLPVHVHFITLNLLLCKVLVADWFGLPWIMFPPNIASNTQIEHGAMCWLPIDFCHLSIDHTHNS